MFSRTNWPSVKRIIRFATGVALTAGAMIPASAALALSPFSPPPTDAPRASKILVSAATTEPGLFGFSTVKLGPTIYDAIWREASSGSLPDNNADLDTAIARLSSLPIGERVRAANAWLNARVRYAPDTAITDHHWGNLRRTLARGRGAHEDIAIAKLQLLAAAGVPRREMSMVMVRDLQRLTTNALLVVRDGSQVYVLGGDRNELVDASETGRYFPVLAFSSEGQWLFGRRSSVAVRSVASLSY